MELLFEVFIQRFFEVRQSGFSFEGFIKAPVGKDHIGMKISARGVDHVGVAHLGGEFAGSHVEEILRRGHLVAAGVHVHLIGGEPQIPHGQIQIRMGLVDEGLEPAVMLLPIGKPTPNDGDVIPGMELQ